MFIKRAKGPPFPLPSSTPTPIRLSATGSQGAQSRNSRGQTSRCLIHCQIKQASNHLGAIFVKGKISCSGHWRIQKRQDYLDSSERLREGVEGDFPFLFSEKTCKERLHKQLRLHKQQHLPSFPFQRWPPLLSIQRSTQQNLLGVERQAAGEI